MPALLEAINRVLGAIALPPTSSLELPVPPHVAFARRYVEEEDVSTQQEGWHFNTEIDVTFSPGIDGTIEAPSNLIQFIIDGSDERSVTVRDGNFYELIGRTDVFTKNLHGQLISQIALDDTPVWYRDYLATRAARRMQAQYRGDPAGARDAMAAEIIARGTAMRRDQEGARSNTSRSEVVQRIYGDRLVGTTHRRWR